MTDKMREEYNEWYAKEIGVLGTTHHKEWFKPWSASRAAMLKCSCCGLTDTAIQKVCHNSDCAEYAQEEELFNGWEQPC